MADATPKEADDARAVAERELMEELGGAGGLYSHANEQHLIDEMRKFEEIKLHRESSAKVFSRTVSENPLHRTIDELTAQVDEHAATILKERATKRDVTIKLHESRNDLPQPQRRDRTVANGSSE